MSVGPRGRDGSPADPDHCVHDNEGNFVAFADIAPRLSATFSRRFRDVGHYLTIGELEKDIGVAYVRNPARAYEILAAQLRRIEALFANVVPI